MRLHRFYTPNINLLNFFEFKENLALDNKDLIHQIKNVLKLKGKEKLILFDGRGFDYIGEILEEISRPSRISFLTIFLVGKIKNEILAKREVILYQALLKKNNFELVVQKAAELGVSKVVPLLTDRSEKKDFNSKRLIKIMIEAIEQSGREKMMSISEIVSFNKIKLPKGSELNLFFDSTGKPFHKIKKLIDEGQNKPLNLFIGPEGGWTERELKIFSEGQVHSVSLGKAVFRAETSAFIALSLLLI